MTPLLQHILSWPGLLAALVAFGFAPGFALRIIVLAFKRSDPRRQELLAELHNIPRHDRPFWVAEQLEVALNEGLLPRLVKMVKRWGLARRIAGWWRNFWNAKPEGSLATEFSSLALLGSGIYLYMLLPGMSRYIALAPWFVLIEIRATLVQRYNKRRERTGEPISTPGIDRAIFLTLVPVTYTATAYMLVHNIITLISGDLATSYWVGTFICVGVLRYPWYEIRLIKWARQQEDKAALEQANASH